MDRETSTNHWTSTLLKHTRGMVHLISYVLDLLGRVAIVAMVLLVITTVCLRWLNITSTSAFELIVLLGGIIFLAPWAYTEVQKGHIRVHMLMSRLSDRVQLIIDCITSFLSLGICCVAIRYSLSYGSVLSRSGQQMTAMFPIPSSIILYFIVAILIILAMVFLIDLVDLLARSMKK